MLRFLREKKQKFSWLLWLVILALSGGMMLLFVGTPTGGGVVSQMGAQDIAAVGDYTISAAEFRRHYLQMLDQYRQLLSQNQGNPDLIKQLGLGQQALNQLISSYALVARAEKMGLQAVPSEVSDVIVNHPNFQIEGNFIGAEDYKRVLLANQLTPAAFEETLRQALLREKIQSVVTDPIRASDSEIREEFLKQTLEAKVRYVVFDRESSAPDEVSDAVLEEFFQKNQERYKTGDKRKVKYVKIEVSPTDVEVTPEEVRSRLTSVPEAEQVRASHILIGFGEDEDQARTKAEDILKQLRSGADFAELAKAHSDDGSALSGGDLGFFGRGRMVPEFEQAAFALNEGEISDIVRTDFGFHIIKLTAAAKAAQTGVAEHQVRLEKADLQAKEKADAAAALLQSTSSLEQVAEEYGTTVQESPYFTIGDTVPGLAVQNDFNQRVFALTEGAFLDEAFKVINGSYALVQLLDIQAAEQQTLASVRDQVLQDYNTDRSEELARERAEEFHQQLQSGKTFEATSRQQGLNYITTEFFKHGAMVDDNLRFSADIHEKAFGLEVGAFTEPILVADKYIVFELIERTEMDAERFEEEREGISQRLTEQKRSAFFNEYVTNLVDDLRQQDRIQINQALLDQVTS